MSHHQVYDCGICKERHSLRDCPIFIMMPVADRRVTVRTYNYCMNCLAKSHTVERCSSPATCRKCGYQHHTMLHPQIARTPSATSPAYYTPRERNTTTRQTPSRNNTTRRRVIITGRHNSTTTQQTRRPIRWFTKNPIPQTSTTIRRPPRQPTPQHAHTNNKMQRRRSNQRPKRNQHILAEAIKSIATVLCKSNFA
ncbi:uncharacterized protein LOC142229412 [Haematobia irritans]|uniref:uncharacterized protein LOC142224159 n=1 Tax=Haematobia irritans TaxID=7368 RepID=UPI003F4F9C0C